jgi:hypothetical protein
MLAKGFGAVQQAKFQGKLSTFNSRQSFLDAGITRQNAEARAKAIRRSGRQLTGRQRVSFAKSGIRLEGTPLEVMAESIENIELDAIATKQQGDFKARQLEAQGKFQKSQADAFKRQSGPLGFVLGALGGGGASGAASLFG